jgi:hypothetical protein
MFDPLAVRVGISDDVKEHPGWRSPTPSRLDCPVCLEDLQTVRITCNAYYQRGGIFRGITRRGKPKKRKNPGTNNKSYKRRVKLIRQ